MCAATKGGLSLADVDVTKEAVIQGRVLRGGNPVAGAYVRCSTRAANSPQRSRHRRPVTSASSPSDGKWTLRTLAPGAQDVDRSVVAARGSVKEIDVDIEAV